MENNKIRRLCLFFLSNPFILWGSDRHRELKKDLGFAVTIWTSVCLVLCWPFSFVLFLTFLSLCLSFSAGWQNDPNILLPCNMHIRWRTTALNQSLHTSQKHPVVMSAGRFWVQYVLLLCRPRGRAVMVIIVVLIFHPVCRINCLPADEGESFKDQAQLSKTGGGGRL